MLNLIPDYVFDVFGNVSLDFLLSLGVKGIVLDIDNTLEPYEHSTPGEHVIKWLDDLKQAGISAAIVSNNKKSRVETFNMNIGIPAYFKAAKPFKKNVLRAMMDMGTDVSNTVLMGDQIFTDIWAAHNAGIKGILVSPINDKKDIFTKFKRLLEKPILEKYYKTKNTKI